ncbi:COP9 signalosome complex subunit 1 [Liparis tanakae]|uniref:COP9 signalosome complex subunit 1 n=1 Tax=Liparis tanakae TaxID=230148 RepID=A0A4Z2E170_9TELE|nr:COP9 signalosome complex subunit 1 [Liparis tanakae]
MWLLCLVCLPQGSVEPMQIDADPQEDQQNAPDTNYIVENPTLVLTHSYKPSD